MTAPPFQPPARAIRAHRERCRGSAERFVFAWEREDGCALRFELPMPSEPDEAAILLAERAVKFGLWAGGGHRLYLAGNAGVCKAVGDVWREGGEREFDRDVMCRVYGEPVSIVRCEADAVPASRDAGQGTQVATEGCRLGFDLGASDYKIAAVQDGVVRFSDEFPWTPRETTDPDELFRHLDSGLRRAAGHLPRVDAIGGSTAGIVVGNRLRVASLLRSIPAARYAEGQSLFKRLEQVWGVPVEVRNDGDVTALAAALTDGGTAILGVAMGSSEAAGYLDRMGRITGRLNELAFAPVDFDPGAPHDEWSGGQGVGASYFSQQGVCRLAERFGIEGVPGQPQPERLAALQRRVSAGDARALEIFDTLGAWFGHTVAWYREWYDVDRVLVLGRVTSGTGGERLLVRARAVLAAEYPDCAGVRLDTPDEQAKRLGQAVAAAALSRA